MSELVEINTFVFYPSNSTNKEPVRAVKASTWLEAANTFATVKNLSLQDFLDIYTVEEELP